MSEDARRVEALLEANAALAAEVRSLALGRRAAPRSAPTPTSRRLAAQLAELEGTRAALAQMTASYDDLLAHNRELAAEIEALRSGVPGILRRARARLLRTRG